MPELFAGRSTKQSIVSSEMCFLSLGLAGHLMANNRKSLLGLLHVPYLNGIVRTVSPPPTLRPCCEMKWGNGLMLLHCSMDN